MVDVAGQSLGDLIAGRGYAPGSASDLPEGVTLPDVAAQPQAILNGVNLNAVTPPALAQETVADNGQALPSAPAAVPQTPPPDYSQQYQHAITYLQQQVQQAQQMAERANYARLQAEETAFANEIQFLPYDEQQRRLAEREAGQRDQIIQWQSGELQRYQTQAQQAAAQAEAQQELMYKKMAVWTRAQGAGLDPSNEHLFNLLMKSETPQEMEQTVAFIQSFGNAQPRIIAGSARATNVGGPQMPKRGSGDLGALIANSQYELSQI